MNEKLPQTPIEDKTNPDEAPDPSETSAPADDSQTDSHQYRISDKELGLDNVAPSDAKVVGVGETDEPYFDY